MKKSVKRPLAILATSIVVAVILSILIYPYHDVGFNGEFWYDTHTRDLVWEAALIVGLISGFVSLIMLFRKKWRRHILYPVSIVLSCCVFFFIFLDEGRFHITKDAESSAVKCAKREFNKNGRRDLSIVSVEKDTAKCFVLTAKSNNRADLYNEIIKLPDNTTVCKIYVDGEWNDKPQLVWSKNLLQREVSDKEFAILNAGGFFDGGSFEPGMILPFWSSFNEHYDIEGYTDQKLASLTNIEKDRYFEYLRNIAATGMIKSRVESNTVYFNNVSGRNLINPVLMYWFDYDIDTRVVMGLDNIFLPSAEEQKYGISKPWSSKTDWTNVTWTTLVREVLDDEFLVDYLYELIQDGRFDEIIKINKQKPFFCSQFYKFDKYQEFINYAESELDLLEAKDPLYDDFPRSEQIFWLTALHSSGMVEWVEWYYEFFIWLENNALTRYALDLSGLRLH